jgi:hypothetical protein
MQVSKPCPRSSNNYMQKNVTEPKSAGMMTQADKSAARQYLMLKRRRSGVIKGRGYADGRKQRAYMPKEYASAPTVVMNY